MIVTEKRLDEIDKKILKLSGEGLTAKEIGYELNKSHRSVEHKIAAMKKWFKCKSITELVKKLT